jgi:DNA-binding MarR family transcriptional regulator
MGAATEPNAAGHSAACLRLMRLFPRVMRGIRRYQDQAVPQTGVPLSPRHVAALEHLRDSQLSVGTLADRLDVTVSTVSGVLADLDQAGLVERSADQADRRRTIVTIRPDARLAVEEWLDGASAPLARVLDRLDTDERAAFIKAMDMLEAEFRTTNTDGAPSAPSAPADRPGPANSRLPTFRARLSRSQSAADQGDGGFRPRGDGRVQGGELGLGDVQASGWDRRAELDQDGAQVDLDRQQVAGPAAGHDGHRDGPGEAVAAVPVQEGLEHAGVGGLIGRRGENGDVGGGDLGAQQGKFGGGGLEQARGVLGKVNHQMGGRPGGAV